MKGILKIIMILMTIFLFSCSSIKLKQENNNILMYKEIASSFFSYNISYLYSDDGDNVICVGTNSKLQSSFSFFVFSLKKNKAITEVFNNIEKVEWVDGETLRYRVMPGTVQYNSETTNYTYLKLNN